MLLKCTTNGGSALENKKPYKSNPMKTAENLAAFFYSLHATKSLDKQIEETEVLYSVEEKEEMKKVP